MKIIVFLFLLTALQSAFSAIVSFNFGGVITSKDDPQNFLGTGFAAGSLFTGNVTFDTTAASTDFYPDNPAVGLYAVPTTYNLTMSANGHSLLGTYGIITVEPVLNGLGSSHLEYGATIESYDGINLPPGFTAFGYSLDLTRNNPPFLLTDDALPTVSPNLSDADVTTIVISAQDPTDGIEFTVLGNVTQISPVPEPGTMALAAIGAAAFLGCRSKKSASHSGINCQD